MCFCGALIPVTAAVTAAVPSAIPLSGTGSGIAEPSFYSSRINIVVVVNSADLDENSSVLDENSAGRPAGQPALTLLLLLLLSL